MSITEFPGYFLLLPLPYHRGGGVTNLTGNSGNKLPSLLHLVLYFFLDGLCPGKAANVAQGIEGSAGLAWSSPAVSVSLIQATTY